MPKKVITPKDPQAKADTADNEVDKSAERKTAAGHARIRKVARKTAAAYVRH